MTPHQLYKFDVGLPLGDAFVGLATASGSYELLKLAMDERLALPLCALAGAAAFLAWLYLKRLLPRNYVPDTIDWMLQPAVYRVTRDDETPPLTTSLDEEKHARRRRLPH